MLENVRKAVAFLAEVCDYQEFINPKAASNFPFPKQYILIEMLHFLFITRTMISIKLYCQQLNNILALKSLLNKSVKKISK